MLICIKWEFNELSSILNDLMTDVSCSSASGYYD